MARRSLARTTFGSTAAHNALVQEWIDESGIKTHMVREYGLRAAYMMDDGRQQIAATETSGIKVVLPTSSERSSTGRYRPMAPPA
jgi:alkylation response protein AidB-like acyl-CoA dehydrogenase